MPELTDEQLANPFTDVYNALWTLLLRNPLVDQMVKVGNRVNFSSLTNRDVIKQTVADSDLPELTLIPEGTSDVNLGCTSSTSKIKRRYSFICVTGDYRLAYRLLPLEWFIFASMTGWRETLTALQWHGTPYVKTANLVSLVDGETDSRRVKGLKGWTAIWSCEVEMHFTTAHLRELIT